MIDRRAAMGSGGLILDAYGKPAKYANLAMAAGRTSLMPVANLSPGHPSSANTSGNTTTLAGEFYHPLFEPSTLMLPTRSREINQWSRHFFRTDGICRSAIEMHAEFPLTGFYNVCDDSEIKSFYDELAFDILHLDQIIMDYGLEFWKLGNVFMFLHWNESEAIYDDITLLNPDYMDVVKSPFSKEPYLSMQIDDNLKNIISTKNPPEVYNAIPDAIKQAVISGRKIALNPYIIKSKDPNTQQMAEYPIHIGRHIAMKASHYETLGTPLMYSVMKVLFYKDLIRRAQIAIAKRHITPIKVVKVGAPDAEPSQEHIDAIRNILASIESNPHQYLVTHYAISVDYIASNAHILQLQPEYEWVDKELLAGLLMSKAVIYGEGPTFAAGSPGVQMLLNRYLRFEKMTSRMIEEYIYKPIAIARGFWKKDKISKRYKLIYPRVEWEMMKMRDDVAQKNLMSMLLDKKFVSRRTFYRQIGLDYDTENKRIAQELMEAAQNPLPVPPTGGAPGIPSMPGAGASPPGINLPISVPPGGGAGSPIAPGEPGIGAPGKPPQI